MSFKENLLKKIKIDRLGKRVIETMGPVDSGRRIDKEAMRSLLDMSNYILKQERGLDLYLTTEQPGKQRILVLDNDLPIYNTTVDDVVLRKEPIVKEMLNIRNMIKILNDTDVICSKKEKSLEVIKKECIDALDLSYSEADIESIKNAGVSAYEKGETDGVLECLSLFAEMLDYKQLPKAFHIENHEIIGRSTKGKDKENILGPIVIYNTMLNTIQLIEDQISRKDKEKAGLVYQVAFGKQSPTKSGLPVFDFLKEKVVKSGKKSFSI